MSTTAYASTTESASMPSAASLTAAVRIGAFLIVAGVGFVILALDAPAVLSWLYDLLASGDTVTTMGAGVRFGAALFGALTFGWGVTILQLGRARSLAVAITSGTVAWFVVDSVASVLVGYAGNVVINVAFTLVVLGILRFTRR